MMMYFLAKECFPPGSIASANTSDRLVTITFFVDCVAKHHTKRFYHFVFAAFSQSAPCVHHAVCGTLPGAPPMMSGGG